MNYTLPQNVFSKSPGHRIISTAQVYRGGWGAGVGREFAFVNVREKLEQRREHLALI